jgi:tetratricopeptide (TPR) repeat protein
MMRASISGIVTTPDGTPLGNIRVQVQKFGTAAPTAITFTRANGSFEIPNLQPGPYEVVAVDGMNEAREQIHLDVTANSLTLRMPGKTSSRSKGLTSVAQLRIPDKARHLLEKARNAFSKHNLDETQRNVAAALAIAPDYAEGLTFQAGIKLAAKQPQSAVEDLDHAVKADPTFGQAYLMLGAAFNELGKYDEALRSLDRGSMYDSKCWQCAVESSKAWLGKQDYAHALQQANRAEILGAGRMQGSLHLLKAYALMGQKQFQQASVEFQAYLTAEPNGELAGTVRATMARMKTEMAQSPSSLTLPAMTGFFAEAH